MRFLALALAISFLFSAAVAQPSADPVRRSLTWFNYLAGDDIREACVAGSPDRYRVVYSGPYFQQIRAYDWTAGGGSLSAFATRPSLAAEYLSEIVPQFQGPETGGAPLSLGQESELFAALEAAGVFGPVPVGEWLDSQQPYWVAIVCREGGFHFNVWTGDTAAEIQALGRLPFVEPLLSLDNTGVPMNWPVRQMTFNDELEEELSFRIRVGATGLQVGRNWR